MPSLAVVDEGAENRRRGWSQCLLGAGHRRRLTGTQTSGKDCMSLADLCVVEGCDVERNRVASRGPVLPSSESLTHGAIYDLTPHIRVVLHAHSPVIWRRARELRLPTTDPLDRSSS